MNLKVFTTALLLFTLATILRRVFHSNSEATGDADRRRPYGEAPRLIAEQARDISLWCKTNAVVAQRDLTNLHVVRTVDFIFLKDVARRGI